MDENTKKLLLEAAAAGYDLGSSVGEAGTTLTNFSAGAGFHLIRTFVSNETGFKVAFFRHPETDQCIMSFAGTEDILDAYADLNLGLTQFYDPETDLKLHEYFELLLDGNANLDISFTGHSLGGALAQYAAFEFATFVGTHNEKAEQDPAITPYSPSVSLFTINGLGGVAGLTQDNSIDKINKIAATINAAHYRTETDIVSRLGDDIRLLASDTTQKYNAPSMCWRYLTGALR